MMIGGMILQELLVKKLPFKVSHAILAATAAKAAHSDLLANMPVATKPIKTLEDKMDLIRDFVYIGYSPAFVADPKNKALLDTRVRESASTRRPAKIVRPSFVHQFNLEFDTNDFSLD